MAVLAFPVDPGSPSVSSLQVIDKLSGQEQNLGTGVGNSSYSKGLWFEPCSWKKQLYLAFLT